MSDVTITHIGGPTVLVEFEGWRILTDPTFDPPGRTYSFGLGTSSRKVRGPAIEADRLGRIDAVLLTHDHHADNLDDAGRALLPKAGVVVTTRSGAKRIGSGARGLSDWESSRLEHPDRPSVEISATPCRHGPPGARYLVGEVIGFGLTWEGQRNGALWVSGDTVLCDKVRRIGERLDIGTALLHLGSVQFPITGPLKYSMTAADALELCDVLRPDTVVPVHYEGWSHFRQQREPIEAVFAAAPDDLRSVVRWARIGDPLTVRV
jgi:L-ascorbate metabolism protein UlaG (beta-lactamase superfamily)